MRNTAPLAIDSASQEIVLRHDEQDVRLLVKQVIQALDVVQLFACLKDPTLPTVLNLTDVQCMTGDHGATELMGEAA